MITPGIHEAVVVRHSFECSRNGNWGIRVTFKVGEDEIQGNIWLTPAAMGTARKSIKAIGFEIDKKELVEMDVNQTLLAGNKCQLDIQEEVYNDELRTVVKWINPIPKPKDPAELTRLTAALRAVKKQKPAGDASLFAGELPEEFPF